MASDGCEMTHASDVSGHQPHSARNMTMHKIREHVKSEPVTTLISLSTATATKCVDDGLKVQPIYEDIDTMNPLKIAPVSGVFQAANVSGPSLTICHSVRFRSSLTD